MFAQICLLSKVKKSMTTYQVYANFAGSKIE